MLWFAIASGCGEGLPSIPIDASSHDACGGPPPLIVDASASEIQCRVDESVFVINDDDGVPTMTEQVTNELGAPICCEVCAVEDTADDACEALCKHELCSRGRDAHIEAAQMLSGGFLNCVFDDCGFSFASCMDTNLLHPQLMTFPDDAEAEDLFYTLQASCHAHAEDPVRADGLFAYLEGLGSIPGAGGGLANVEDVVAYCLEHQPPEATGSLTEPTTITSGTLTSPLDEGADSTVTGTDISDATGDPAAPPQPPTPCGPYATERFWVRPSNNFGAWNEDNGTMGVVVGEATFTANVTGGGIAYTLFPSCGGASASGCLRIDQLSVQVTALGSGLVMHLGLVEESAMIPMTARGSFEVPVGGLRLAARYAWGDRQRFHVVTNDQRLSARLSTRDRSLSIEGLAASYEDEEVRATLSLAAIISNSQPSPRIIESRDVDGKVGAHGRDLRSRLRANHASLDDPGRRELARGDSISPALGGGRHAVILYADDLHRARGVAARWVEATESGVH